MKYFGDTLLALKSYDRLAEILDNYSLQKTIIDKLDFDSGLARYLSEMESLHQNKPELCVQLLSNQTFIKIFSENRRLLYNSGMFFNLKKIGLSVALRADTTNWGVEGEIGKVFYYYIVEDFNKAIKKAKTLLVSEEVQADFVLQSELYNVKGLSERKLVLFDDALESFENNPINLSSLINIYYCNTLLLKNKLIFLYKIFEESKVIYKFIGEWQVRIKKY